MEDGPMIAAAVGAFAGLTWLLAISFFLGRYAAKVDAVGKAVESICAKLDALAILVPHACIQERRLAALEARQTDMFAWRARVESTIVE